ncbi:MAG: MucB/RseB C-terminal domain-containing protein [Gammaproteobacteria bacterium]
MALIPATLAVVLASVTLPAIALAAVAAETPSGWLERMVESAGQTNFRGTVVHMCGGKVDVVNIVRRVENGNVTERVKALDADGREIIRNADEVMCIMPDRETVTVDSRGGESDHADILLSPASSFARVNGANYRVQTLGEQRVAGRKTEVIAIRPTDDLRYGYRLWLDHEYAMPLKYELIGSDGDVLEQTLFTEIEILDHIAEAEVEPTILAQNFAWQRTEVRAAKSADAAPSADENSSSKWQVAELPAGFVQTAAEIRSVADSAPMTHLVYSDGLASVSVFIEKDVGVEESQPGASHMGAVNGYTTVVDDWLVTAVGGVPVRTVMMMALSAERSGARP